MQFTTSLLSLLGLAASVTALPSEKRQNGERIYAKYYSDNGCGGIWRDDTVWVQNRDGTCIDVNNPFQYNSTLIADNLATLKLRAYSAPGCNENTGNYYDVPPGVEQCYAQLIRSVKYLTT